MFTPLMQRVALAKALGLMFGLLAPAMLSPATGSETMLVWGVVLWAVILGALVGFVGEYDRMPLLDIRLPMGLRGAWVGSWMGLILVLVAHEGLAALWTRSTWLPRLGPGVWWLVLEAALVGLLIDIATTAMTDAPESKGPGHTRHGH